MPETQVLEISAPPRRRGIIGFFATGPDLPLIQDPVEIDRLYSRSRMGVLLCIMIGYGLTYPCRLGLSIVKKDLIDGNIFTTLELGTIGASFFYTYAFGRLLNGFLADHANLKRFLSFGILLTAVVNLIMGTWHSVWLWALLWGLNGWFQGFGSPSCIVSIARWFGPKERGRAYGTWSVAHGLGEGVNFLATAGLVVLFGWRLAFLGPGVLCVVVAILVYKFMLDRPQTLGLPPIAAWRPVTRGWFTPKATHGFPVVTEQQETHSGEQTPAEPPIAVEEPPQSQPQSKLTFREQLAIMKIPALWVICLASAAMYMTRIAINNWGVLYLQEARSYSLMQAGSMMFAMSIGGMGGCVAYGFISDLLFNARRPPVTLIFGIIEVLSLLVIFFTPPGHVILLTAAFVIYGFTLSGLLAVLGGLFAVDIVPKRAAGAAIGLTGIFSYLGAGIQENVSSYLVHHGTSMVNGVRVYDFSGPITFWIGASVVSLLLAASCWRAKVQE